MLATIPMPDYPSRSSVHIDISESPQSAAAVLDPDAPFRILILGDFTGRVQRGEKSSIANRRAIKVDCDNFEEVIGQLDVRLDVPGASLRFRELDHFHPDHIYRSAPVFEELQNLRPATSAQAPPAQAPPANLLESMIGESESHPVRAEDANDLAAFIRRVSAKHME